MRLLSLLLLIIALALPSVSHAEDTDNQISRTAEPDTLWWDNIDLSEIEVVGKSNSQKLRESNLSVNALDIRPLVNSLTNLNDIVDRSSGVRVRRQGGVGSDYDLSINGLSGNSIRYFIDGVPLESKGTDVNLANLPVNLIERVEVYKGVVPSHLGSDALGGAINIVTRRNRANFVDASVGAGSFHTYSADATAQINIPGTAVVIRPTFSYNYSKNDYKMKNVEVWDEEAGNFITTDANRFHDRYRSVLAQIEGGVSNVSWADAFFISASYSKVDKQLQTGSVQNKVYGSAERNSHAWNISARYTKSWEKLHTSLDLSHTWDHSETVDTAYRKYYWDGSWIPSTRNEINGRTRSIRIYNRPLTLLHAGADYDINEHHNMALNYMLTRTGNERSDKIDDTFTPSSDVVSKSIISLTYSQNFIDNRLINTFFVKDYINFMSIEQNELPSLTGSDKVLGSTTKNYMGAGLGSRFTVMDPFSVKASYEHSVRLPLARELLGNGTTINPNLALKPESSNNYNLGVFGTWRIDRHSTITYEANGFLRHVQNYIRANVSERDGMMQYDNEPAIRIKGCDFQLGYNFRNRFNVTFNGTYNDARNMRKFKTDGKPSATYKNRVPNTPWMFSNLDVAYSFYNLISDSDRLRLSYDWQWIHWYFLNWETYGSIESKARIPNQNTSSVAMTYSWNNERYNLTVECHNIFDCTCYDNYMLQKPGRSLFAKFRIFINQ